MKSTRTAGAVVIALLGSAGVWLLHNPPAPRAPTPDTSKIASLYPSFARLSENRHRHLSELAAYIADEVFPRNHDFPDRLTPYFIDEHETACAVAHLMIQDGMEPLVRDIARADNHVRVMDVASGPFVDWILHSGLTQEECAQVQPRYNWERPRKTRKPPVLKKPGPAHDTNALEKQRVRAHLMRARQTLQDHTPSGLETAFRRILPETLKQLGIAHADFQVHDFRDAWPARDQALVLTNASGQELRIGVTRLAEDCRTASADSRTRWISLRPGESWTPTVPSACLFVEWHGADALGARAVTASRSS